MPNTSININKSSRTIITITIKITILSLPPHPRSRRRPPWTPTLPPTSSFLPSPRSSPSSSSARGPRNKFPTINRTRMRTTTRLVRARAAVFQRAAMTRLPAAGETAGHACVVTAVAEVTFGCVCGDGFKFGDGLAGCCASRAVRGFIVLRPWWRRAAFLVLLGSVWLLWTSAFGFGFAW